MELECNPSPAPSRTSKLSHNSVSWTFFHIGSKILREVVSVANEGIKWDPENRMLRVRIAVRS